METYLFENNSLVWKLLVHLLYFKHYKYMVSKDMRTLKSDNCIACTIIIVPSTVVITGALQM